MKSSEQVPVLAYDETLTERRNEAVGEYMVQHKLTAADLRRAHEAALVPTTNLESELPDEDVRDLARMLREYYDDHYPVSEISGICDALDEAASMEHS